MDRSRAPPADPGIVLYARAYAQLSTCRPEGQSQMLRVPWTAVDRWFRSRGMPDHVVYYGTRVIECIDAEVVRRERVRSARPVESRNRRDRKVD